MALALRLEALLADGGIGDHAEVARLGQVSRARVCQIMNLSLLAPDIQTELLFLPPERAGRGNLTERDLRPIAAEPDWSEQRRMWRALQTNDAVAE